MATAVKQLFNSVVTLSPRAKVTYSQTMNVMLVDSALMLRYKEGDVAAFEILYRRHNDSLYRYLLRRGLNHDTAEDVFQDVWSKIIKSRSKYRPTAKFTTFLYRESRTDPNLSANPTDEPDLIAEKSLARNRLDAALLTLPDEQRDVFLLHEEAGLTLDIIAHVTGVNRETAKSRLRYAMNKLRSILAEPAKRSRAQS